MNARAVMTTSYTRAGFTLIRCKNHFVWRCPCGHAQLVDSGSCAGGRGHNNAQARIARTLKACKKQEEKSA